MKTIFYLCLGLLSPLIMAKDMQKYLRETEDMVTEGKYEEALKRFSWFHNNALKHDKSMYGVRLSFALGSWFELGKVYPPARAVMVDTRNRDQKTLLEGKGDSALFHDLVSFNETLDEVGETVSLFKKLDQKHPESAKECWSMAKDAVIAAKEFKIAKKYMGDLLKEYSQLKFIYDQGVSLYDNPQIGGEEFRKFTENSFVRDCLQLIEVAHALDEAAAAKKIRAMAFSVVADQRLKENGND